MHPKFDKLLFIGLSMLMVGCVLVVGRMAWLSWTDKPQLERELGHRPTCVQRVYRRCNGALGDAPKEVHLECFRHYLRTSCDHPVPPTIEPMEER